MAIRSNPGCIEEHGEVAVSESKAHLYSEDELPTLGKSTIPGLDRFGWCPLYFPLLLDTSPKPPTLWLLEGVLFSFQLCQWQPE